MLATASKGVDFTGLLGGNIKEDWRSGDPSGHETMPLAPVCSHIRCAMDSY